MELKQSEVRQYLSVLSDGKFHKVVPEGTSGAVVREYEDSKGVKGSKLEMIYDEVIGKITNISFEDGEFGKNLQIELDGDGIVSMSTSGSFGEDFMKKIPAIDLTKNVKLVPYAFEADGKSKKGISVYQDDVKINNYYYNTETKENTNGFPIPDGDTAKFDSDDWKMYFMVVRKFLVKQIEQLIADKFNGSKDVNF